MTDHSARIAALEDAAGSGELTIKVDGKETTYRSMDDLLKALRYFKADQSAGSATGGVATTLAVFGGD